jgi:hypothetical protein
LAYEIGTFRLIDANLFASYLALNIPIPVLWQMVAPFDTTLFNRFNVKVSRDFCKNRVRHPAQIGPNGYRHHRLAGFRIFRARAKITLHVKHRCILAGGVAKARNMLDMLALSRPAARRRIA